MENTTKKISKTKILKDMRRLLKQCPDYQYIQNGFKNYLKWTKYLKKFKEFIKMYKIYQWILLYDAHEKQLHVKNIFK